VWWGHWSESNKMQNQKLFQGAAMCTQIWEPFSYLKRREEKCTWSVGKVKAGANTNLLRIRNLYHSRPPTSLQEACLYELEFSW
jgi:hypothetical protein